MHMNFIHAQASLMMIAAIWSVLKHPWWLLLDFIHVQASLMNIEIWSMSKQPWWWLLQFDLCPSILDYVDWDFINVQASIMMTIVILSILKHPTCWFDSCPSILDGDYCNLIHVQASLMNVDWDFINVQAYLMMMRVWSMHKYPCWWSSGFNPCLKTNFLSSWPKFGHATIGIVIVTKFLSRWQKIGRATIGIVIVTKFLSRWQKIGHATIPIVIVTKFLSSWPNFCHDDKKLVTRQKIKKQKERP